MTNTNDTTFNMDSLISRFRMLPAGVDLETLRVFVSGLVSSGACPNTDVAFLAYKAAQVLDKHVENND